MMRNKQKGASLVVALVLLTIITLVAVYSIEGSTIQSKMIANSLFSTLTYQDCRNEQEANIRFFNENGGEQRTLLLNLIDAFEEDENGDPMLDDDGEKIPASISVSGDDVLTKQYQQNPARSTISYTWSYMDKDPGGLGGEDKDDSKIVTSHLFQNDCISNFRFSTNSQSLGVIVQSLTPNSK